MKIPIWRLEDGRKLKLLTSKQIDKLKDGTWLICIDGTYHKKGKHPIDRDTRFGYTAFGLLVKP